MAKGLEEIKINLQQDIKNANTKEIEKIYVALQDVVKTFDKDSIFKNLYDAFKGLFKSKRAKCLQFVDDLSDSLDKLSDVEKSQLKKALLDISNIHRTIIENIVSMLGVT